MLFHHLSFCPVVVMSVMPPVWICAVVLRIYTAQLQVLYSPLDKGNITHICRVM